MCVFITMSPILLNFKFKNRCSRQLSLMMLFASTLPPSSPIGLLSTNIHSFVKFSNRAI